MTRTPQELVEALITRRVATQLDELVELYAPNAIIASHGGTAQGTAEIRSFLAGFVAAHGRFDLLSIDALTAVGDVVLFDASVETVAGVLQIAEEVIVDPEGAVSHHLLGLRGYWGR
jgi:hypothetical protein